MEVKVREEEESSDDGKCKEGKWMNNEFLCETNIILYKSTAGSMSLK